MSKLNEIEDKIQNFQSKADNIMCRHDINRILDIVQDLLKEVRRIDDCADKAASVASCLANGIQPD